MKIQIEGYVCSLLLLIVTTEISASTPDEMAELSLQELLAMSTDEDFEKVTQSEAWSFSVLYTQLRLNGYMNGSKILTNKDVLFEPGVDTRPNKNFPVLQREIVQQALIASIN